MQNKEIASRFTLLGKLLEIHGENAFKSRSYANAGFQIKRLDKELAEMEPEQIGALKGIGTAIQSKIRELLDKGQMDTLDKWLSETPPGIVQMLSIKGLGAKKLGAIWKELEVESPGELLYACYENRLALLKGFGAKTQDNFIKAIEYFQESAGFFHYASLEEAGFTLLEKLNTATSRVELTGPFRRKAITLECIELIADTQPDISLLENLDVKPELISGTYSGLPVKIHISDNFEEDWFKSTASEAHLKALPENINFSAGEETAIYSSVGLSWIPPEMREGIGEIQKAKGELNSLLTDQDIKGVVHNHSTYSDGGSSIEAMAEECVRLGYEYLVMSDHSKSAVYAGGLTVQAVEKQHREIEALNKSLAPFKIFKSIESDILSNGSLDYDEDTLSSFDLVIASVHSGLRMDEAKATDRLLKAIKNPYTTILGHPTGRLLLSRAGYPVDYKTIIKACAEHNVILELNSNPWRLDADYSWLPFAIEQGVQISIDPDAHALAGIKDIHWGVAAARKGGISKSDTWNTKSLSEVEEWLYERAAVRKLATH